MTLPCKWNLFIYLSGESWGSNAQWSGKKSESGKHGEEPRSSTPITDPQTQMSCQFPTKGPTVCLKTHQSLVKARICSHHLWTRAFHLLPCETLAEKLWKLRANLSRRSAGAFPSFNYRLSKCPNWVVSTKQCGFLHNLSYDAAKKCRESCIHLSSEIQSRLDRRARI